MGRSSFCELCQSWTYPEASVEQGANIYPDATAVVRNLENLESTLLDKNLNRGRAGVYRILHKLFQCMDWRNDNLPCSNLVDDIGMECLIARA